MSDALAPGRELDADEIATMLSCTRAYIYQLAARGELPCIRYGKRMMRFRAEDVVAFRAAARERSAAAHASP